MLPVEQPFKTYTGLDGKPLNNGSVYLGLPNQDPITHPVTVYWDAAGTLPAAQPLRTLNGYIVNDSDAPANVFFDGSYSETVIDSKGRTVFAAQTSDDFSISTAVKNFIASLASSIGSSLLGFVQAGVGAIARTIEAELRERVSVKQFGAVGDGVADDTAAFQKVAAYLLTKGGGRCHIPAGVYLITASITTSSSVVFHGDGDSSQLLVNSDIEVFKSDTSTPSAVISNAILEDFYINKTVSGATSKYDIHLSNAIHCTVRRVHIKSGHGDSSYSSTNTGGIWFEKPSGSTSAAYMNLVDNCWIQNNSIWFGVGVTDSVVRGGFVWGHTRAFAIRIDDGSCAVENVAGIISSQYQGGIYLGSTNVVNASITGNFFDGNPAVTDGTAVNAPQKTELVIVARNRFWNQSKSAIDTVDPVGWVVDGNTFWNCNRGDNFYHDVQVSGATFSPNRNSFTGNIHFIDQARTNKGFAYREQNSGFAPTLNRFGDNTVSGVGYQGNLAKPATSLSGWNSDESGSYAPGWLSSGTAPNIGNGTLSGTYVKNGRAVTVSITVTMGSTTTFGSGSWYFTLPSQVGSIGGAASVIATRQSTGVHYGGVVDVPATQNRAWPTNNADTGSFAFWTPTYPFTWAVGDTIRITATYLED